MANDPTGGNKVGSPRTRSEIANGLKWRASNLRRSANDYISRAKELEQCVDEILARDELRAAGHDE